MSHKWQSKRDGEREKHFGALNRKKSLISLATDSINEPSESYPGLRLPIISISSMNSSGLGRVSGFGDS